MILFEMDGEMRNTIGEYTVYNNMFPRVNDHVKHLGTKYLVLEVIIDLSLNTIELKVEKA